jgi:hypothetical protein
MRFRHAVAALTAAVWLSVLLASGCSPTEPVDQVPADSAPPATTTETPETVEEEPVAIPFALRSAAFADGERIPTIHALGSVSGGENVSVPLEWEGAPEGTASFVLAMVDRHPVANNWVHWLVVDIPPDVAALPTDASGSAMPDGSREVNTTFGRPGYGGPAPPAGSGEHDYEFTLYALDVAQIDIGKQPSADEIERAVETHTLASARLIGTFSR